MFGQLSSLGHQSYLKERSITSLSSNENLWIKGNDFFGPLVSENQEPLLLVNFLVSQSGTPLNHPDYGLIDTNDTTENRVLHTGLYQFQISNDDYCTLLYFGPF